MNSAALALPIDPYIPSIIAADHPVRIITATPGSGKTTRIPPAVAENAPHRVLCIEPRRLACIAAANRIAEENHWKISGNDIGYHVRHEKKVSDNTKLCFITTGMMLQYLCANPFLDGISEIIFDEFHERSLENDIAIAMVRYLQRECRDDLRIDIMSATLDAHPIAEWLSPAQIFDIKAPIFPLEIRYCSHAADPRDYSGMLIDALHTAMQETNGDCLVFLPGTADIRKSIERAEAEFADKFLCLPCYASLPLEEQRALLNPISNARRRIIFSTNVAESSLTIPGVHAVIDLGFAKRKFFDSTLGLSRLETQRISRASADQRAGRAARLGPGLCIRLWDEITQNRLEPQTAPDIDHLDLSQIWLQIAAWGLESPENLDFLTNPAPGRLADAKELLQRLDAVHDGNITNLGKEMAKLPVEPRLARWLIAADRYDCLNDAALLAAFLSEAPYRKPNSPWKGPDLFADFVRLKKDIRRPEYASLRRDAEDIVTSALDFLPRSSVKTAPDNLHEALGRAMLCAYPDRIAQPRLQKVKLPESDPRRDTAPIHALMSGNRGVTIKEPFTLKDAKFFICADLNLVRGIERASNTVIKAFELKTEWLPWKEETVARYEEDKDRTVVALALHFDIFTLRETFLHDDKYRSLAEKALLAAAQNAPLKALSMDTDAWKQFSGRLQFVRKIMPETDIPIPVFDEKWAKSILPYLVHRADCFADLRRIDLVSYAQNDLPPSVYAAVKSLAPERIVLENGWETAVDYTADPPVIRVKIQKAFGTFRLPRIGGGKIPVMIHLCAPNGRAAQITQDLDTFWRSTYTDVRKLLRGRYPKHDWPEKPPGV